MRTASPGLRRALRFIWVAALAAAVLIAAGPGTAHGAAGPKAGTAKPVRSLRLYILDCGTIGPMDPGVLQPETG